MSLNWFSATIDVPVLVLKAATIDVHEPVPVEVPDEIKIPGEKRSHIYQKKEPQEDVKDSPEKIERVLQQPTRRKSPTPKSKKLERVLQQHTRRKSPKLAVPSPTPESKKIERVLQQPTTHPDDRKTRRATKMLTNIQ